MTAAATSFPTFAPASAAERGQLIVSLHDVAPPTWESSQEIIRQLRRHGVPICSLLVVPDYHHSGPSMANPEFVAWLRELEADGHEIVLHGYFHARPPKKGETWPARLLTQSYTNGEGEFYDLDYAEAFDRITRARDEFAAAGLHPRGFIAPAWLLNPEVERAAAAAELEYTTRLTTITDLRRGQEYPARSLVYSVRSGWRRTASLAWNGSLAGLQSSYPLVRLGLHPPDLEHARIWTQIRQLTERFTATRRATTYRDWIAEQRAHNS